MAWFVKKGKNYYVYERFNGPKHPPKCQSAGPFYATALKIKRQIENKKAMYKHSMIDFSATLWDFCDKYINLPTDRAQNTLRIIGDAIKQIKNYFSRKTKLVDLTEDDIDDFIKWLMTDQKKRKAYNHTTTHMCMRNFCSILNYAITKKIIAENVIRQPLKRLGEPAKRDIFLTFEQQDMLLDAAMTLPMRKPGRNRELWKIIKVLHGTGVRRAELLNMHAEHMISSYEIEIPTKSRMNQNHIATKSKEPYTVALNNEIAPFFREVKSGPIFPGWTDNSLANQFKRCVKRAGLPGLTPHGLRHTFSKDALQSGTRLPELRAMLNHKNIQTTMRYVRFEKSRLKENVDAMIRPRILRVA